MSNAADAVLTATLLPPPGAPGSTPGRATNSASTTYRTPSRVETVNRDLSSVWREEGDAVLNTILEIQAERSTEFRRHRDDMREEM